ncbi:hypothetical protein D3C86_2035140 [compost metagenome]
MIKSVRWLEDASQSVSPACGSVEDGSRKGKSARPAVEMMPNMPALVASSGRSFRRVDRPSTASAMPAKPITGAAIIQG